MAMCPGDTTQWEDIHRRLGNFAAKPKEVTTDEVEKFVFDMAEQYDPLADRSLKELDKLEDDVEEDTLAKLRRQRLAELKQKQRAAKFGEVRQVRHNDFVAEVTEASADGQWVLVLLFVESSSACHHLMKLWSDAARLFPAVKFLRGVASEVVPKFPDSSTPTVLIYRNRDCFKQIIGLDEWGGRQCNLDCIEWVLAKMEIVQTEMEDDPRERSTESWHRADKRGAARNTSDSEESEEDEEGQDRCYRTKGIQNLMRLPR
mmetsp:Transcript_155594/g.290375  ORF Transcript_155594/g.290375 Transcript_155594/m.290375 type:complete len:260 (-) Transcript_155594:8-787(-)